MRFKEGEIVKFKTWEQIWVEEDDYSICFNMLMKCSKNKRIN